MGIDVLDDFIGVVVGHHHEQRTKSFPLPNSHLWCGVQHQMKRHLARLAIRLLIAETNNRRALLPRVLKRRLQTLERPIINLRGVVV